MQSTRQCLALGLNSRHVLNGLTNRHEAMLCGCFISTSFGEAPQYAINFYKKSLIRFDKDEKMWYS